MFHYNSCGVMESLQTAHEQIFFQTATLRFITAGTVDATGSM